MHLPSKVYEPDVDLYGVSYYPRKNSNEDSLVSVAFPAWFTVELLVLKERWVREGYEAAQKQLRAVLGVK